jgi:inner membrane protein
LALMDNLTHSIAGMLIAEGCLRRALRRGHAPPRALIYATSICANNLPDLDFVMTPLTQGKLGYLLHHRGHTHTVLIGLTMALAQAGLCTLWLRQRGQGDWAMTGRLVAWVSCIGVLVHLLLDFGNNYGVHPFWPVDSRWFYGDAAFIIEPWWWSFGGATLFVLVHSRVAKGVQLAIWALGTALAWALPLPLEARLYSLVLGTLALSTAWVPWAAPRRLVFTASILAFFYGAQVVARGQATRHVSTALASNPALRVLDLIQTPFPSAPWCWDVIVVGMETHDNQQTYVLRLARATALPGLNAERCPVMRPATTAPLRPVTPATTAGERVYWDGEYRLPAEGFARLAASCWGHAFLRFSRAPFVVGEQPLVGDLRFDRAREIEFTELELPEPQAACPRWTPGWHAPRQDVVEALSGR